MSNINLYKSGEDGSKEIKKKSSFSGVFFFSILVLFLVLISWVAVKVAKSGFESKKEGLAQQLTLKEQEFSPGGANIKRVYDFTKRVEFAKNNVESKTQQSYIYSTIETWMITGVKADEISYTDKNGSIEAVLTLKASKFVDVARQVLAFKESKKFAGILVESISREEKDIVFKIKALFLQNKEMQK